MKYSPVRKIKANARSITGTVPRLGDFESSLERDFMELIRFENNVESFTAQPLTISFEDDAGVEREYTPDGLIEYKVDKDAAKSIILYEIKYRADLREFRKELFPKFRAARAFCQEKGWRFKLLTERQIRTNYLENVRFLYPFKQRVPDSGEANRMLEVLLDLGEVDPDWLLCAAGKSKQRVAELIPVLWYLIANDYIHCDLSEKLTMRSKIWAKADKI